MTQPAPDAAPSGGGSLVSRWPVYVLIVGMALAIGLVLFLADANGRPVASPPIGSPGTAAAPRPVTVIMRDYHFDPTPLHLYPGETIRLTVINAGMVEHELVLGDAAVQSAWAAADAAVTAAPFATAPPASAPAGTGGLRVILASGGQTTVTYVVPDQAPLLLCNLPGHQERGMVGEVVLAER